MTPPADPHYRHRFPAEIISHAVWLYHVSGATHTRFAHSIGVLHMARLLMQVIQRDLGNQYHPHRAQVALAAALVHDVGHGMFSHAFEEIGRKLNLPLAHHETVSERLIRDSGIAPALGEFGGGFAQALSR